MCAIFGIVNHPDAAHLSYMGLHALQHRGSEGCGIVATDGLNHHVIRRVGLVQESISKSDIAALTGHAAIGHTRYATTGDSVEENIQPVSMRTALGLVSVAHNGNLTNAQDLIRSLQKQGSIFQTTTDTEVILHLMARSGSKIIGALQRALSLVEGAYSLLVLDKNRLIAVRDPYGFRPLVMGRLGSGLVFASETCAFDLIGAEYEREVAPGEMVIASLTDDSYQTLEIAKGRPSRCVFEQIYFSRPDSVTFGADVYSVRKSLGVRLAKEQPPPVEKDVIVVPVPDSGVPAAIGYAQYLELPYENAIIRSHYAGRTFILPKQSIRDLGVRLKFNAVRAVKGKNLLVVDDSLVRGTTSKKLIEMLRNSGAKSVHLRISAPPTLSPCCYGIDTPTKEELLASKYDVEQIREYIGADSLGYLSLEGLMEVATEYSGDGFCHACFSGQYPTERLVEIGYGRLQTATR